MRLAALVATCVLAGALHAASTSHEAFAGPASSRIVETADVVRVDGSRVFHLNVYRGLTAFDVADGDHPKLLSRIAHADGAPVALFLRGNVAIWIESGVEQGAPDGRTRGSVVHAFDVTDATHPSSRGSKAVAGHVVDAVAVGEIVYALADDETTRESTVSSFRVRGGALERVAEIHLTGDGGILSASPSSLLVAHTGRVDLSGGGASLGAADVTYIDAQDAAGALVKRGTLRVPGSLERWGSDHGRPTLAFAGGRWATLVTCASAVCGPRDSHYVTAIDFANPDKPALGAQAMIPPVGGAITARFDDGRLYVAARPGYAQTSPSPFIVYDARAPRMPTPLGAGSLQPNVWTLVPSAGRLLAIGTQGGSGGAAGGFDVSLRDVDVRDPAHPRVTSAVHFGAGWTWTPASESDAGFAEDRGLGLVALPFSSGNRRAMQHASGVQLVQRGQGTLAVRGAVTLRGSIERCFFRGGRLFAVGDLGLWSISYADATRPLVVGSALHVDDVTAVRW